MSITVMCECGHSSEALETNAGFLLKCPICGRVLIVPNPTVPQRTATSRKAIMSLALGALFFCVCFSGVPAILLGGQALNDIALSEGRLRGRKLATAGMILGLIGCLYTLVMPQLHTSEAARRAQCVSNLKQIALAFHNYHEAYGSFPAAAITDKRGRPLLSWRAAILPYLESTSFYSEFHLDEPWDSTHNLSLLDRMPSVYACPSDRTLKTGMTGYQAVVGPGTAFTTDFKPLQFQDFTDGSTNTLLVGESRRSVPWTKPEDLPLDMTLPLNGRGSHHPSHDNNGFNAVFADGSVRFLKGSISRSILGAILTRNGNEVVSPDDY